jgi:hypothetical protein
MKFLKNYFSGSTEAILLHFFGSWFMVYVNSEKNGPDPHRTHFSVENL